MGLTDNFHSRYDLNMPVGVDFPSRLDPGFQSTSKSLECQRFKNLVSLTEKLVLISNLLALCKSRINQPFGVKRRQRVRTSA